MGGGGGKLLDRKAHNLESSLVSPLAKSSHTDYNTESSPKTTLESPAHPQPTLAQLLNPKARQTPQPRTESSADTEVQARNIAQESQAQSHTHKTPQFATATQQNNPTQDLNTPQKTQEAHNTESFKSTQDTPTKASNPQEIQEKENKAQPNPTQANQAKAAHPPLLVSITSFPARIGYLHHTLYSLFMQEYKDFHIALFLSEEEFPNKKIPTILRIFARLNLITIHWVQENLRAYKKLFYAVKLYPNHAIITIDDDQMYDSRLLTLLLASYRKHPDCIHINWAYGSDFIAEILGIPPARYDAIIQVDSPHIALAGVGVGGILYPPQSFPKEFFNTKAILSLCPYSDDLWFFVMSVLHNVKKVLIVEYLEHPKESSIAIFESPNLWEINCNQNRNYEQFSALMRAYPEIKKRLVDSIN